MEDETVDDAEDEAGPGAYDGEGGKISVLDVEHYILVTIIVITPAAGGGTVV